MKSNNMNDVSPWILTTEADKLIAKFIEDGVYERNELKKSSRKFANGTDKSGGYLVRVMAVKGKHPELEVVATSKRGRKATKPKVEKMIKAETTEPLVSDKVNFLRDIQLIDGKYRKLYSNDAETRFVIEYNGEKKMFNNVTDATVTFYGSAAEAKKHFWAHVTEMNRKVS